MRTDCMLSTHAIEIPIDDAKLIDQVFDALRYTGYVVGWGRVEPPHVRSMALIPIGAAHAFVTLHAVWGHGHAVLVAWVHFACPPPHHHHLPLQLPKGCVCDPDA